MVATTAPAHACTHCGGRLLLDRENAFDETIVKCIACGRSPQRVSREPTAEERGEGRLRRRDPSIGGMWL